MSKQDLTPAQFNAVAFEVFRKANLASLNFHHEDFLCREGFPNASLELRNKTKEEYRQHISTLKNLCEKMLTSFS